MIKYSIRNRWTDAVLFTAEIDCDDSASEGTKRALAIKWARKAYADLRSANLSGADLRSAVGAALAIAQTRILADGDLIGWKKCNHDVIVKLRIPEAAKRSHAFGRKCRAEYADVLEVIGGEIGISCHDSKTKYKAGERVTPDSFDNDWMDECSHGVHFFITRAEAEAY